MPSAGALNPYHGEAFTISSTAKNFFSDVADFAFTQEQIEAADVVHITVYTNQLRYRYDGDTVTALTGYTVAADEEFELIGKSIIRKFSFIRDSADTDIFFTLLTYGIPVV